MFTRFELITATMTLVTFLSLSFSLWSICGNIYITALHTLKQSCIIYCLDLDSTVSNVVFSHAYFYMLLLCAARLYCCMKETKFPYGWHLFLQIPILNVPYCNLSFTQPCHVLCLIALDFWWYVGHDRFCCLNTYTNRNKHQVCKLNSSLSHAKSTVGFENYEDSVPIVCT